ncbi:MAG: protein kinase [Polyangiaceae bacterium]|nr:protein kinase [Polyangiaceae bacterium]
MQPGAAPQPIPDATTASVVVREAAEVPTGSIAGGPPGEAPGETRGAGTLLQRRVVLGRYVLLSVLGRGGMAVVYSAYDPELDRKVALKLVKPGRAGEGEWQARLLREAQAMARLHHPHVLAVHDVGVFEGQVFVAMPLIEGGSLRGWLSAEPQPRETDRLDAFLKAGQGLAAAHEAGVVHRDFKPENVLCGEFRRGTPGLIVVTDFGLARFTGAPAHAEAPKIPSAQEATAQLTETGVVFGTPRYMSPEQARGEEVDARSDQFSFAVALHEALFGSLPHERANPFDPSTWKPLPPARNARVPARARRALLRAVDLDPRRRFPSMNELLAELTPTPWSARRLPVLAAAVALTAATVALARQPQRALCTGAQQQVQAVFSESDAAAIRARFAASPLPFAAQAAQAAVTGLASYGARWASMQTEACAATRIRGAQSEEILDLRTACLDTRLHQMKSLVAILKGASDEVIENTGAALASLADLETCADIELLRAPISLAPALKPLAQRVRNDLAQARTLRYAVQMPESRRLIEEAREAARASRSEVLEAEALFEQGDLLQFLDEYGAAEEVLRGALLKADASRHDDIRVRALAQLAAVGARSGATERMGWWYESAQAALRRMNSASLRLETALPLGEVLLAQGRLREARNHFSSSRSEAEQQVGGGDVRTLELSLSMLDAASVDDDDGWVIDKLKTECDRNWGPRHPCQGLVIGYRGDLLVRRGQCEGGLELLRQAQAWHEQGEGAVIRLNVVDAVMRVAIGLECAGEHEEARKYREREAAMRKELEQTPCVVAGVLGKGALSRAREGDIAGARGAAQHAVEVCAGQTGAPRLAAVGSWAWVLLQAGRNAEALGFFQELAGATEGRAEGLWGQGEALLRLGQPAAAIQPLEEALRQETSDPFQRPLARMALGRALWESRQDRCRGRALFQESQRQLDGFQGRRARAASEEARGWLAQHQEASCGS